MIYTHSYINLQVNNEHWTVDSFTCPYKKLKDRIYNMSERNGISAKVQSFYVVLFLLVDFHVTAKKMLLG